MNALSTAIGGLQSIVDAPVWVVLQLKITAILLAAWFVHMVLRQANPRWRVLLWRVTGCGLVALPLVAWIFPVLPIHVQRPLLIRQTATVPAAFETIREDRTTIGREPTSLSGSPSNATARSSKSTPAPVTPLRWPCAPADCHRLKPSWRPRSTPPPCWASPTGARSSPASGPI